ncbi:MAG: radical SAM family heme chaperone HemW [Oscillospiraceae bacterium]
MSAGIYVHVPFCAKKCGYCDFYSVAYSRGLVDEYVDAVCRNIRKYAYNGISADTLYFGGGTPSLLEPEQLERIIFAARTSFGLQENVEITLEANPCTVNLQKLSGYKKAGINRISLGVQSADDKQLKKLGRLHNFEVAESAVYNSKKAGIDNISCDIMLGIPDQSMNSLVQTINLIAELPITHISAYMLKIEEGTLFDCESIKKSVADDDLLSDMYLKTVELLEEKGFAQYEISNFAKSGFESRHNLKYWQGKDYIGIGPGAYSFYKGKRFYVPEDAEKFVRDEFQTELDDDNFSDKLEEYIMLSLRLTSGAEFEKIEALGGKNLRDDILRKAKELEKAGYCKVSSRAVSLTPKGFLVSNSIIAELT